MSNPRAIAGARGAVPLPRAWTRWLAAGAFFAAGVPALAARIGDTADADVWGQAARFWSMQDPSVRLAVAGALLLGLNCGLLGGFLVVRRLALAGDMLSHAVLPGIVAGFLWAGTKNPLAILAGALAAGVAASAASALLERTTKLKPDAIQGLVLASFYGAGICLLGLVQNMPSGAKSGLDKFLFGQVAALSGADVALMAVSAAVSLALLAWLYHHLLLLSFHRSFGASLGLPMAWLHGLLMFLTTFAVIVAMQAAGVVLVSAMLVIPAATASLLTDRMHRLLILSVALGMAAALLGAFTSFLGSNLSTGPLMVLAGWVMFAAAFLAGPRHGWLTRLWRQRRRRARTERENTLKAMHRVLEDLRLVAGERREGVTLEELGRQRRDNAPETAARAAELVRAGLATLGDGGRELFFTPEGERRARAIVRNHRLWELYLTHAASFSPDHVHDQAEEIEHILGEDMVRQLARRLDYPEVDPHGRPIPLVEEGENSNQLQQGGLGYQ
jgi:ABC-type Mn2+/Zn2+ transport system permease subunit/Mn-dependent DtxR family transcriptional regulator